MSRLPRIAAFVLLLLGTSACNGLTPRPSGQRGPAATPPETTGPQDQDQNQNPEGSQSGDADIGDSGSGVAGNCPGSITLTVAESAHTARPSALVEAGIPLAPGAMTRTQVLTVCSGDEALPVRSRPLSYWPDGSVRWALAQIPLALKSGETRRLTVAPADGKSPAAPVVKMPAMSLKLRTERGEFSFDVKDGQSRTIGDHFIQTWVEPLTSDRVRVTTHIAQLNRDASWRDLSLEIAASGRAEADNGAGAIRMGEWTAAVYRADGRGPVNLTGAGGVMRLSLYPGDKLGPYPADKGYHVSHQIILERGAAPADLARRINNPVHGALDPAYIASTGAAGLLGDDGSESRTADRNLVAGVENLRRLQQKPENRGMASWGDFTADEGSAYMGYYNHEYDPDSAILQYVLHSGDTGPLDDALDMAIQFADNCVNLKGQVYQHRSTTYAVTGTVGKAAGAALVQTWRQGSDRPADDERIVKAIDRLYPPSKDTQGRAHKLALRTIKGVRAMNIADPAGHEREIANSLGYFMAEESMQEYRRGSPGIKKRLQQLDPQAARRKPQKGDITTRDLALVQRAGVSMAPLDKSMTRSVDDIFAPFFARYGGDWDHFPRLHFYDAPNVEDTHSGSHTLVEMLVWSHLLTGDPHLRDMALRIAADFVAEGGLVDRTIEVTEGMNRDKDMVHIRTAGWTLINLLALETLTTHAEPALAAALAEKTDKLVSVILAVPPRKYEGIIHAGVVSEALSRYHHDHQKDRPELASRALNMVIDVGMFFTGNQWAASENRFYYRQDDHSKTLKAGSYLMMLGLAYGGTHAESSATRNQLLGCAHAMLNSQSKPATTPKALGMMFRSTFRALAVLQGDDSRTKGR